VRCRDQNGPWGLRNWVRGDGGEDEDLRKVEGNQEGFEMTRQISSWFMAVIFIWR